MSIIFGAHSKAPVAAQPTVLQTLRVQSSTFGQVVPIVWGQGRLSGKLIWYGDFTPIPHTSTQAVGGKGGGGGQHTQTTTSYTYQAAVAILLCEGQVQGLYNVWDTKGKIAQQSVTENFTVPGGGGTYTVANGPNYYDDYGVSRQDAYSYNANDYGDIPRTYSGNYQTRIPRVTSAPTTGQYKYNGGGQYQFAAGDAGKQMSITYTYTVPDTSSNGQATQILSLTLFTGAPGQSPWSYLTTNHPGQDIGYNNSAYVASQNMDLGTSGSMPNYTYEVIGLRPYGAGITDANPSDIINDLITDPRLGVGIPVQYLGSMSQYSNYCIANGLFISLVLDAQQECRQIIEDILKATNSNCFWSEGVLKFVPYGDTTVPGNGVIYVPQTSPVVDLTDSDFEDQGNNDPITVQRADYQDAENSVKVEWTNRSNSYNLEIDEEKDQSSIEKFGYRPGSSVSHHFITTSTVAAFSANTQLKRKVYIRKTYQFTIGWRYSFLEPMDLVTLTDSRLGFNKLPVRITEIEEDEKGKLQITAEEFPWGTATATLYPKQAPTSFNPQTDADPGNVNTPIIYEPTARASQYSGYELWIAVSGQTPQNFGGCYVYVSPDNSNYKQVGQIIGNARMGTLTATLANTADPDTVDTLSVDLTQSQGTLSSGSLADCDNFRTLCLVDTELISYETATLTSTYHYNLTTKLRRGVFGSAVASHSSGAKFLRIDDAVLKIQYDPQWIGQTVYFKFVAFNTVGQKKQNLSSVTAYSVVISGVKGSIDQATGLYIGSPIPTAHTAIDRYKVVAAGLSYTGPGGANSFIQKNGTTIMTGSRSYNVVVITRSTMAIASQTNYDVFGSSANATSMANALNALDNGSIVIIFSYDEPSSNRLANGLQAAMERCGASKVYSSVNFQSRASYILIGIPGIGLGNGAELYQGTITNDPAARVETSFTIVDGEVQAMQSSIPSAFTMDEVPNGLQFGKVVNTALSLGNVDLSLSGVTNKTLQYISDDAGTDRRAATLNQKTGGDRGFAAIDSGNVLVAGSADFSRAYTNKHLGNIPDDGSSGRYARRVGRITQGSGSAWFKLGTWVFATDGTGHALLIDMVGGVGFNSVSNQQGHAMILVRSSNNAAAPNISGATWVGSGTPPIDQVKVVATGGSTSASNNSWEIWVHVSNFGDSSLQISLDTTDTWTTAGTSGADPGAGSSTVVVGTGQGVLDASANLVSALGIAGQPLNVGQTAGRVNSGLDSSGNLNSGRSIGGSSGIPVSGNVMSSGDVYQQSAGTTKFRINNTSGRQWSIASV